MPTKWLSCAFSFAHTPPLPQQLCFFYNLPNTHTHTQSYLTCNLITVFSPHLWLDFSLYITFSFTNIHCTYFWYIFVHLYVFHSANTTVPWGQIMFFESATLLKSTRGDGPPSLDDVAKRKQKAHLPLFLNLWRTTLVFWNISAMAINVACFAPLPPFFQGRRVWQWVWDKGGVRQWGTDRELKLLCKAAAVTWLWSDWLPWHVDMALPVHTLVLKYALSETLNKHLN